MTIFSTAESTRGYMPCTIAMITTLILLINLSFKIIAMQELVFSATSILSPLIALIYLWILRKYNSLEQRHILNQALLALYLFSIGIYLLVNLPTVEYMHDNSAYQIVFDDIPKKFFAATLAFVLCFYLPHLLCSKRFRTVLASPNQCLLLALAGGFFFFTIDFFLLFSYPYIYKFKQIYIDSLLIASCLLLLMGIIYLVCLVQREGKEKGVKAFPDYWSSSLYHYLVAFSVTILLICLACEYKLVSFNNGWILTASALLFPLTLMASNLVGEIYGYQANLRLVVALILTELVFDLLLMITIALPAPEFFNLNPFYSFIMPRRIPAATLVLLVTFFSNALLLEKLKQKVLANHRALRILVANLVSTSLLCLMNYKLLFGGVYPEQSLSLTLNVWIYKFIVTLMSLPVILWLYKHYYKQASSQVSLGSRRLAEKLIP